MNCCLDDRKGSQSAHFLFRLFSHFYFYFLMFNCMAEWKLRVLLVVKSNLSSCGSSGGLGLAAVDAAALTVFVLQYRIPL